MTVNLLDAAAVSTAAAIQKQLLLPLFLGEVSFSGSKPGSSSAVLHDLPNLGLDRVGSVVVASVLPHVVQVVVNPRLVLLPDPIRVSLSVLLLGCPVAIPVL